MSILLKSLDFVDSLPVLSEHNSIHIPTLGALMIDRRIRRSQDPYRALCLQLEQSRLHGAFEAVVVATDNGLLVAGAGEPSLCDALCAVAPIVAADPSVQVFPELLGDHQLDVRPLVVQDDTVYVASAGATRADLWLQRSVNGVRRILDDGVRAIRRPTPPDSEISIGRQLPSNRSKFGIANQLRRTAFE